MCKLLAHRYWQQQRQKGYIVGTPKFISIRADPVPFLLDDVQLMWWPIHARIFKLLELFPDSHF
jgi:hypothetical protein